MHAIPIPAVVPYLRRLAVRFALAVVGLAPATASAELVDVNPYVGFRDLLVDGRPCHHCPEMIHVPAGSFLMGAGPREGHDNERGPHGLPFPVRIEEGMAVGVGAVTRGQFAAFVTANPGAVGADNCAGLVNQVFQHHPALSWRHPGYSQSDDHPVVCVTWQQAKAYARWLTVITGKPYRLLTEAEWEYTARAGSRSRYWWGDRMRVNRANCFERCGEDFPQTAPAQSFEPNGFGLFNSLGNVWEWVEDCYDADAYRRNYRRYPRSVGDSLNCPRVIRGGSWRDGPWSLRAANRGGWRSERSLNDIGFRVARFGRDMPI